MKDWARQAKPNGWFTIAPLNECNLDKFLGTIRGPTGTPYEGGIFHVRFNLNGYYPFRPPRVWFVTRILHPNIDSHGAICTDLFGSGWAPSFTLEKVLVSVASILDEPIWEDPIQGALPSEWTSDQDEFQRRALHWTRKYATGHIIFPGEGAGDFYTVSEMAYGAKRW
ncbi:UBC-like protein [Coniochaeta sp. PMI_546]|nr:UBC-like protein [Coniochaeta sp. PMI_546]